MARLGGRAQWRWLAAPAVEAHASAAAAEQWQQAHYMGGADSGIKTAAPGSLTGHEGGPEGYDYVAGQGYTQQQVDGE